MPLVPDKWIDDPDSAPGDGSRTGHPFRDQTNEEIVPKVMRDFAYEVDAHHDDPLFGHIPWYPNAAARDSAITFPLPAQLCIVANTIQRWTGASWSNMTITTGGGGAVVSTDTGNDITTGSDTGVMFDHNPEANPTPSIPLGGHIPRFITVAQRNAAIPSPINGQACILAGDLQVYQTTPVAGWQTAIIGSAATSVVKAPSGTAGTTITNTALATWAAAQLPPTTIARPSLVIARIVFDVTINTGGGYFQSRIVGQNATAAAVFEQAKRAECRSEAMLMPPSGPFGLQVEVNVFGSAGALVNGCRWEIFATGGVT